MKVVLIEDELPAQNRMTKLLQELKPDVEIIAIIDTVEDAVSWLQNNEHPDLLFLDIQLADGLSFDIFDQVQTQKPVIFCTAFDEYAIQAFKLNSIDYLLKPIDPKALASALEKYSQLHQRNNEPSFDIEALKQAIQQPKTAYKTRFMVKIGERIHVVETKEAAFFYSAQKATYLQTWEGKKYIIDFALDDLEKSLDPTHYFRVNRKYIIHIDSIENIVSYSNSRLKLTLQNCTDQDILISRDKVSVFKDWLDQ